MSEKITVAEFKDKVYEEFKKYINFISDVSAKETPEGPYKADTGVATDMFITYVDNNETSVFVDIPKAKARLAELRIMIG